MPCKKKILICTDSHTVVPTSIDLIFKNKNIEIEYNDFLTQQGSASLLSEYAVIVLDLNKPHSQIPNSRWLQLKNFISKENKSLICFLNQYENYQVRSSSISNYMFYDEFLNKFGINQYAHSFNVDHSGSTFGITEEGNRDVFKPYLDGTSKVWNISFNEHATRKIIQLAVNSDNETIAAKLPHVKARVYFIPLIKDQLNLFWNIVIDNLVGSTEVEDVDEWVEKHSIPGLESKNDELKKVNDQIERYLVKQHEIKDEIKYLIRIRDGLLYRNGHELHEVIRIAFKELGLNVVNGPDGLDDLRFSFDNKVYILEVKGREKSAAEADVKQLNGHVQKYIEENVERPTGILIVNSWRKLPLEERNTSENKDFPDQMLRLTNIYGYKLMTSTQLFFALCQKKMGNFDLNQFIHEIDCANPIVSVYMNEQATSVSES